MAILLLGHPSLIDWHARSAWWIADFLPNLESEIGMVLAFVGMIPIYWPGRSDGRVTPSAASCAGVPAKNGCRLDRLPQRGCWQLADERRGA